MAVLVVGSVVVYSFFLPQTAPKQITLAVVPFTESDEFTPLAVGFTAALRDSIAMSRDVAVVDNVSSMATAWNKDLVGELTGLLATTHLVDGSLTVGEDGQVTAVQYRVINVTHPNWKEVRNESYEVLQGATTPLQSARDHLTTRIRGSLYDNSHMRVESKQYSRDAFLTWLSVLGESLFRNSQSMSIDEQVYQHELEKRAQYDSTGLAGAMDRELFEILEDFESEQAVANLKHQLWLHLGKYPNSSSSDVLGQLFADFGNFEVAERLWLRLARIRAQSSEIAIRIADLRWRMGQTSESQQAMKIAQIRAQGSDYMRCYQGIFSNLEPVDSTQSGALGTSIGEYCDFQLAELMIDPRSSRDLQMHLLGKINQTNSSSVLGSYIGLPPKFMPTQDPRWQILKANLLAEGYSEASAMEFTQNTTEDVEQLLAPQRPD